MSLPDPPVVVARPEADATELPASWEWWDDGRRTPAPDEIRTVLTPPVGGYIVSHTPAVHARRVSLEVLRARADRLVDQWRTGGEITPAELDELPPDWHRHVLRRVGYADTAAAARLYATGRLGVRQLVQPAGESARWVPDEMTAGSGRGRPSSGPAWERVADDDPDARIVRAELWEILPLDLRPIPGVDPRALITDPRIRVARAAAGTPVPEGWQVLTDGASWDEHGPWAAPLGMDRWQATQAWMAHLGPPPARLTTVRVRRNWRTGRWAYGPGQGTQTWGEAGGQDAAVQAATSRLRREQDQEWEEARRCCGGRLDWTGWPDSPPPPVAVVVPDLVGITEIAARLGVRRQTVDQWRQRGGVGFPGPSPDITIGGRPVWDWADVEAWARQTGRGGGLP
jgi:hypothetical protein